MTQGCLVVSETGRDALSTQRRYLDDSGPGTRQPPAVHGPQARTPGDPTYRPAPWMPAVALATNRSSQGLIEAWARCQWPVRQATVPLPPVGRGNGRP